MADEIRHVTDLDLWAMRTASRKTMIENVRERYGCQVVSEEHPQIDSNALFDEKVLTVGFARRFTTYKRLNLLLHDPERLLRLLCDPQRPMQLIIAGKAHPEDLPGRLW